MVLVERKEKTSKEEWSAWLDRVRKFTMSSYLFCDEGTDNRPYLEIELCGELVKCLLDTGA